MRLPSTSFMNRLSPRQWLVVLLFVGLLFRGVLAFNRVGISHDEAISYLAATANQQTYEDARQGGYPLGSWVPARAWQRFLQPQESLAFTTIATDLGTLDIHPPMYFWLLHLWSLLWGVHPWSGPALNMIFFVVGALFLFRLSHAFLQDEDWALAVTFIWALSPAVLVTSAEARQYDLFGVVAVAWVWCWYVWSRQTSFSVGQRLTLVVVTAVGALTHFHFVLVAAAGWLLWVAPLWRTNRRRLVEGTLLIIGGYLLSLLLHPTFWRSWQSLAIRQEQEATYFSTALDVARRLFAVADTFTGFWVINPIGQTLLFCLVVTAVIVGALRLWRQRREIHIGWTLTGREPHFLLAWLAGISILLYLTFISPIHAMTFRHMSAVWPFYSFLPLLWWRRRQPTRAFPFALVVVLMLVSATWFTAKSLYDNRQLTSAAQLAQTNRLLIDTAHRGILPRVLIQLPPDSLLFAASQSDLLENPDSWLLTINEPTLYLSDLSYGNDAAGQTAVLALLGRQNDVTKISEGGVWGSATLYLVEPRR